MSAFSSTEADASGVPPTWVSSFGGPLLLVPSSALAAWGGCTDEGMIFGDPDTPDDYDRACAVDGLTGVVPVDFHR
ncbi:Imm21 family immunity protein [Nocardiopsis quinghaiensis]|uniref:Imm21 family immunity protein n=1 Tax=Nocardiopsis quinghaiensis TaxID=464995 RepID=UPI001238B676|nr:Imm21 family immunity protein [Nocardiopsis quinghaiensis]